MYSVAPKFSLFLLLAGMVLSCGENYELSSDDPAWESVPALLMRILPPTFPAQDFEVGSYGARADGRTDCRPAFQAAIEACAEAGGGRVVVRAGQYLVNGPLHLRSNVNLHLMKGAMVRFGVNPMDYLPPVLVRWEGTRCYNYSPLIYASQAENIAITGWGTEIGTRSR
jgi:polygalacturonase